MGRPTIRRAQTVEVEGGTREAEDEGSQDPAIGDASRPSARQTRQGPETRPHRQGKVRRQRLRKIVGPQTKGKERAQIVSSSFFRFPSRVDFRETQQEEHLQVDSLKTMFAFTIFHLARE